MDNENFDTDTRETEYGWRENSPPERKRNGVGIQILFGVVGVVLIAAGLTGVLGYAVFTNVSSSVVMEVVPMATSMPTEMPIVQVDSYPPEDLVINISPELTRVEPETPVIKEAHYSGLTAGLTAGALVSVQAELNGINEICINAAAADIIVRGYDSDKLELTTETSNTAEYYLETDGDTVIIDSIKKYENVSTDKTDKLIISIPYSYSERVELNFSASTAAASGLNLNELEISLVAGELAMEKIVCEALDLEMTAGAASGTSVAANTLHISASQAELGLSGALGTTDCKSVVSTVVLDYDAMPKEIDINSSLGTADIYLPENARFNLELRSVMGSVENEFDAFTDAENEISLSMSMGSLNIRKK